MGLRPLLGHRHSGRKPVFLFQIPCRQHLQCLSCALFSVIFVSSVAESSPLRKIKLVPLLLTFPMGKFWARYVPNVSLFGISLNPGPFTVKEHVIITIMAGVGAVSAYAVSATPQSNHLDTLTPVLLRPTSLPSKGFTTINILPLAVSFFFWSRQSFPFMVLIAKNRSVAACHVDPVNWLLDRWYLQEDSRGPAFYDLARESRDSRALQHVALPGDIGHPFPRRCFPWSFLHICLRRLPLIQSAFFILESIVFQC